jgi:hypothetical protein
MRGSSAARFSPRAIASKSRFDSSYDRIPIFRTRFRFMAAPHCTEVGIDVIKKPGQQISTRRKRKIPFVSTGSMPMVPAMRIVIPKHPRIVRIVQRQRVPYLIGGGRHLLRLDFVPPAILDVLAVSPKLEQKFNIVSQRHAFHQQIIALATILSPDDKFNKLTIRSKGRIPGPIMASFVQGTMRDAQPERRYSEAMIAPARQRGSKSFWGRSKMASRQFLGSSCANYGL